MKNKRFLNMDERNVQLARRIIAVMYFITILAITGIVLYRQIILGQSIHEFEDIAIVLLFNSIFFIIFSLLGKRRSEKNLEED